MHERSGHSQISHSPLKTSGGDLNSREIAGRTIYILHVWFADDDNPGEDVSWASELVGSAADSELETDLLSTVADLLEYEFAAPKPTDPDLMALQGTSP
jgi:hypothetical protein